MDHDIGNAPFMQARILRSMVRSDRGKPTCPA